MTRAHWPWSAASLIEELDRHLATGQAIEPDGELARLIAAYVAHRRQRRARRAGVEIPAPRLPRGSTTNDWIGFSHSLDRYS